MKETLTRLSITLVLALAATASLAQTQWEKLNEGLYYTELNTNSLGGKLHAFKISPKHYQLKVDLAERYRQPYLTIKGFVRRNNAVLGINGGFFSPDWKPLGLRVVDHRVLSKYKRISWWGIAALKNDRLKILSPKEYDPKSSYDYAVQCGPRLVIDGAIPKLKPGYAERSAICTNKNDIIIAIVNNHPIAITHFAEILAASEKQDGLACRDALNLDGGSSSQLFSQLDNKKMLLAGLSQITDALVILPRKK